MDPVLDETTETITLDETIEGLTLERYAALMARLDLAAADKPRGQPAEVEARREALREAGVPAEAWSRAHAAFQDRIRDEASRGATKGAPPAERFPLITRYGAVYAAEKKRLLAEQQRALAPTGGA